MHDFGKKYLDRKPVHFGLWAEEIADQRGVCDALRVLQRAAKQTFDDDVRCEALSDAVAYLMCHNARNKPLREFLAALNITDPVQRYHAVRHALVRVKFVIRHSKKGSAA